jgi:hypothetical protein
MVRNAPEDSSQIPENIYYVHSSDGPSSVSVTPKLNHSNYDSWTRSMRRALGVKNKFDFVNGTIHYVEPASGGGSYKQIAAVQTAAKYLMRRLASIEKCGVARSFSGGSSKPSE